MSEQGPQRSRAVPVLLYHSVSRESVSGFEPWQVDPGVFAAQMQYLADEGYQPIRLADYAGWLRAPETGPLPAKPCVITFDDGLADFANAVDTLAGHGFPSTMFVPTAYIGGTSTWLGDGALGAQRIMSWRELRGLRDAGVEIGAHAHVHRPLDERSRPSVRRDVVASKRILEDGLGEEVRAFAYPHGYSDRRVRGEVARASFRYACAVNDSLSGPADDPYAICRIFAPTSRDPVAFARLLEHGSRPMRGRERIVTKGWRTARRVRAVTRRRARALES